MLEELYGFFLHEVEEVLPSKSFEAVWNSSQLLQAGHELLRCRVKEIDGAMKLHAKISDRFTVAGVKGHRLTEGLSTKGFAGRGMWGGGM